METLGLELHQKQVALLGNTYSLACQLNRPPAADAGANVSVSSGSQATTIIAGTGSDPDEDSLTYIWTEGANLLFGSALVGTAGQAPLDLATVPSFSVGDHVLTLEVSDGDLAAISTMTLTVDNTPPTVTCTGAGTFQFGVDAVILGGALSDFDGGLTADPRQPGHSDGRAGQVFAGEELRDVALHIAL